MPDRAVDVGLASADGIAFAKLEWIDLHRARDEVEVRLGREGELRLAWRARVPRGERVRVHRDRLDARGRHVITGQGQRRAAGKQARDRLPRRVRTAIEDDARLMRRDTAVAVDAGPEPDPRGMTGVRDLQLVGVAEDRAHRPTRRTREEVERELVERQALATEVAADVRRVDDDAPRGHADGHGHLLAQRERRFVRRHHVDGLALDPHQARARLDVGLMHARNAELVLEHGRRVLETHGHVAVLVYHVALHVRVFARGSRAAEVRVLGGVGMEHRRVRCERGLGIEDRGQLVVLDRDRGGRGLRSLERVRGDHGDAVADEPHAVPRKHRPVL